MSFLDADTRERLKRFKKIKRAYYSFWLVVILTVLSALANVLANNRPILMVYDGSVFFPIVSTYKGVDFGLESQVEPVYKELDIDSHGWALWPPIRWGENESNRTLSSYPSGPSSDNWLGTDDRGRDILTRLIYGFRVSMFFSLISLGVAVVIAVLVGGVQGYLGGFVDLAGQRIVEVWASLPYLYVLILIVNIYEPNVWMLILRF